MVAYKDTALSAPLLSRSQIKFRLGLARQRTHSYPLHSMDFIMMDLERPEGCHRHAHWCTGDLTGRLLEFLSHAESVDGITDERLPDLFDRILRQREPSGLFGKLINRVTPDRDPFGGPECMGAAARLFPGLIHYYELSSDTRALEAAAGLGDLTLRNQEIWRRQLAACGGRSIPFWITEPMALLYGLTGKRAYLDFVGMICEGLDMPDKGAHAHSYLATLRGLQVAALVTGDSVWNDKPEAARRMIIERHYEMPDGCVPERFPHCSSNEGCSMADWLMLNLNAGAITGNDDAYAHAEHILWNALAFNQWITGCFGHRSTMSTGYSLRRLEEAWWCCLHHVGLAYAEFARHAVTCRGTTLQVNQLLPGDYRVALPGGREAQVRITTGYPSSAEARVCATGVPDGVTLKVRVPGCVKQPLVSESRSGDHVVVTLTGRLGHHAVSCHSGIMLQYGPLILTPAIYSWQDEGTGVYAGPRGETMVPAGYVPDLMPKGQPVLDLPQPDADGLLALSDRPLPDWTYFDEGPASPTGVSGAAANVAVRFAGSESKTLRFTPMCYNTSCLSLFDTPIVFAAAPHVER